MECTLSLQKMRTEEDNGPSASCRFCQHIPLISDYYRNPIRNCPGEILHFPVPTCYTLSCICMLTLLDIFLCFSSFLQARFSASNFGWSFCWLVSAASRLHMYKHPVESVCILSGLYLMLPLTFHMSSLTHSFDLGLFLLLSLPVAVYQAAIHHSSSFSLALPVKLLARIFCGISMRLCLAKDC